MNEVLHVQQVANYATIIITDDIDELAKITDNNFLIWCMTYYSVVYS